MSQPGWQELRLETRRESVEALEAWLFEQGAVAVTLEDNADQPVLEPAPGETPLWDDIKVVALFAEAVDLAPVISSVPTSLVIKIDEAPLHVPDQEWELAWMDNFHPMQMGPRLWVCPSWIAPPEPDAVNVMLDPGLAFGTGTHPTTAMCLGELDKVIEPGMTVVDYGCGTGILGIGALKLGAAEVLGVDNDPQAITASGQNSERNGIDPRVFTVVMPDSPVIPEWHGCADVVVANILAGPLVDLSAALVALLKPGGRLVLAGLLEEQAPALVQHYDGKVALARARDLEGWVLLAGNRSG